MVASNSFGWGEAQRSWEQPLVKKKKKKKKKSKASVNSDISCLILKCQNSSSLNIKVFKYLQDKNSHPLSILTSISFSLQLLKSVNDHL